MHADRPSPAVDFDCLALPQLRGWPALQARLVHHLKRAALRQLHTSRDGEILLLRLYLVGEESSEQALQRELRASAPDWLARQLDQHLADEQLHARLFAGAIAEQHHVLVKTCGSESGLQADKRHGDSRADECSTV